MHGLEGFFPALQFPLAADDGIDVELAGGEQLDHAFSDGPVVAEAALEADVLLHKRVEGVVEQLRSPTNFRDPASGAHDVHCRLERAGETRGVDHAVSTESVTGIRPFGGIADD